VLITANGVEELTKALPRTLKELEELIKMRAS